jgi:hypothetical protein
LSHNSSFQPDNKLRVLFSGVGTFATKQIDQQSNHSQCAQHVQEPPMPMKKRRNMTDIAPQVISGEPPRARPNDSAGDIVESKTPPGHAEQAGDDPV